MSVKQKLFLKKEKKKKYLILLVQLVLILGFLVLWQILSDNKIINPFIFSSPKKVIMTIRSLTFNNNLFIHIWTTIYEVLISFIVGMIFSFILAIILYLNNTLYRIFDPFLTCLNSLPKVAIGPMIIIIFGAGCKSIIVMSVLINIIVSTVVFTNGFYNTDSIKLKLFKSFKANKYQLLRYLVIPNSYKTIISSFKLSISMSMIGVITGEFLVSKAGIGYLIIYGTQIFNLDLVVTGIIILLIISFLIYRIVELIERKLINE